MRSFVSKIYFLVCFLFIYSSCEEQKKEYTLFVNVVPKAAGSVNIESGLKYEEGEEVEITLTPSNGYELVNWMGVEIGGAATIIVKMDSDKNVIANLKKKDFNLDVQINGQGKVDERILAARVSSYSFGTDIQLEASPDPGWKFDGWSGDTTLTTNPIIVNVAKSYSITASFTRLEYSLTKNITGNGDITIKPIKEKYFYGDTVLLTAVPNSGFSFQKWSGDISGESNPYEVIISNSMSIGAEFKKVFRVNVNNASNGSVELIPNQPLYFDGDTVFASAIPNSGFALTSWGKNISSKNNPLRLIVNDNITLEPIFTESIAPLITSTSINNDNNVLTVAFNEQIFSSNDGSGDIMPEDFRLSTFGGLSSLKGSTPSTVVAISDNRYELGINLNGIASGEERLIVNPAENSIFDKSGNAASTSQANNVVKLIDKLKPNVIIQVQNNSGITITNGTLVSGSNFNVKFILSEPSSDFNDSDISLTNGTMSNFSKSSDTEFIANISISNFGTFSIYVDKSKFSDVSGNLNIKSNVFSLIYIDSNNQSNYDFSLLKTNFVPGQGFHVFWKQYMGEDFSSYTLQNSKDSSFVSPINLIQYYFYSDTSYIHLETAPNTLNFYRVILKKKNGVEVISNKLSISNGAKVAYINTSSGRSVHLFDPATGETKKILNSNVRQRDPKFSLDGNKLAFTNVNSQIITYDLITEKTEYIVERDFIGYRGPQYLPNGHLIVQHSGRDGSGYHHFEGKTKLTTTTAPPTKWYHKDNNTYITDKNLGVYVEYTYPIIFDSDSNNWTKKGSASFRAGKTINLFDDTNYQKSYYAFFKSLDSTKTYTERRTSNDTVYITSFTLEKPNVRIIYRPLISTSSINKKSENNFISFDKRYILFEATFDRKLVDGTLSTDTTIFLLDTDISKSAPSDVTLDSTYFNFPKELSQAFVKDISPMYHEYLYMKDCNVYLSNYLNNSIVATYDLNTCIKDAAISYDGEMVVIESANEELYFFDRQGFLLNALNGKEFDLQRR